MQPASADQTACSAYGPSVEITGARIKNDLLQPKSELNNSSQTKVKDAAISAENSIAICILLKVSVMELYYN